jgi:hypothetical protein
MVFDAAAVLIEVTIVQRSAIMGWRIDEIDAIATDFGVIIEQIPGQRMIFFAGSKKAAERHHNTGNLAGVLVDEDRIDAAELFIVLTIDRRVLHLVGTDQLAIFWLRERVGITGRGWQTRHCSNSLSACR